VNAERKSGMNVLVVYFYTRPYPPRQSLRDHLESFRRYSTDRCFYWNAACWPFPRLASLVRFDLIVFHTSFLSCRWNRARFARLKQWLRPLARNSAVKIALPQDEFIHTDLLNEFVDEFAIDHVFSVAPESEFARIYPRIDRRRTAFHTVLCGYLDDSTLGTIESLSDPQPPRTIDIGYRSWDVPAWLGRHGLLKTRIARRVDAAAPQRRLVTDISMDQADTIYGNDWYRFLLRCKYTVGAESGASVLDTDGAIKRRTEEFVARHPHASFDEIERACFPGQDGQFNYAAVAPRHLEACATRTCQVLVRGQYSGILEPGRHYLEVEPDFSNLDEVLDVVRDDQRRLPIVERAHADLVASGKYTYRSFVQTVYQLALAGRPPAKRGPLSEVWPSVAHQACNLADRLSWLGVRSYAAVCRIRDRLRAKRGSTR
jgi:hypothetical protein